MVLNIKSNRITDNTKSSQALNGMYCSAADRREWGSAEACTRNLELPSMFGHCYIYSHCNDISECQMPRHIYS